MSGLIESAEAILALQAKRLDIAGHNIANANTAGYKAEDIFADALRAGRATSSGKILSGHGSLGAGQTSLDINPNIEITSDLKAGKLSQTTNPMDFAISSSGFFQVETSEGIGYTRQGQFHLDDSGRFVTPQGWVVQAQGGGDLSVRSKAFTVQADGTIVEDGRPTARMAVFDLADPTATTRGNGGVLLAAANSATETDSPVIKQGFLEMSNVDTASDMVHLMESTQLAQSAQKLILTYDDLLGRVLSTLGQMQ